MCLSRQKLFRMVSLAPLTVSMEHQEQQLPQRHESISHVEAASTSAEHMPLDLSVGEKTKSAADNNELTIPSAQAEIQAAFLEKIKSMNTGPASSKQFQFAPPQPEVLLQGAPKNYTEVSFGSHMVVISIHYKKYSFIREKSCAGQILSPGLQLYNRDLLQFGRCIRAMLDRQRLWEQCPDLLRFQSTMTQWWGAQNLKSPLGGKNSYIDCQMISCTEWPYLASLDTVKPKVLTMDFNCQFVYIAEPRFKFHEIIYPYKRSLDVISKDTFMHQYRFVNKANPNQMDHWAFAKGDDCVSIAYKDARGFANFIQLAVLSHLAHQGEILLKGKVNAANILQMLLRMCELICKDIRLFPLYKRTSVKGCTAVIERTLAMMKNLERQTLTAGDINTYALELFDRTSPTPYGLNEVGAKQASVSFERKVVTERDVREHELKKDLTAYLFNMQTHKMFFVLYMEMQITEHNTLDNVSQVNNQVYYPKIDLY